MKIWALRLLFLLTFAWWAGGISYLYQGRREPYPALAMPGFYGTGGANETHVTVTRADIEYEYADGHKVDLTPKTFLSEIPDSNVGRILNRSFSIHLDPEVVRYRFGNKAKRDPKTGVVTGIDAPLEKWLLDIGRSKYAGAQPTRLKIDWITDVRELDDLSRPAKSTPPGRPENLNIFEFARGAQ